MIKQILSILFVASTCYAMPAFELTLNYEDGVFSILNVTEVDTPHIPDRNLDESIYEVQKEYGGADDYYEFSITSDVEVQYVFHDQYPPVVFYDYFDENGSLTGGAVDLKRVNTTYLLPFSPGATTFAIFDSEGTEVYRVKLSEFLKQVNVTPQNVPPELPKEPVIGGGEPPLHIWALVAILVVLIAMMFWQSHKSPG